MLNQQTSPRDQVGRLMNFENLTYRRELNTADMERMRIPKRYWGARFDMLTKDGGNESVHAYVSKYIDDLDTFRKNGAGFIFWGINGVGKSCGSVVLAKEFRRRGHTVLFMEASELKRMVIEKEYFDETQLYWDRARNVELLVLDDFGKGVMDSTGFGASLFDELIRARNARKLPTIVTSNSNPREWEKEFDLKKSTMSTLKECTIPVHVTGEILRDAESFKLKNMFFPN